MERRNGKFVKDGKFWNPVLNRYLTPEEWLEFMRKKGEERWKRKK